MLSHQHFGNIVSGEFQAGEQLHFTLARYGDEFLMHIADTPEVYVLYADYGSLGGRVLKYDSSAIALQVSGWGSMTIYTDNAPDGLPVTRIGDAQPIALPQVGLAQLQGASDDEASHVFYVRSVRFTFVADWNALGGDANLRALVYDTLGNTARGIERFVAGPAARDAFTQRVTTVRFQPSTKLVVKMAGKTLIVTYNPNLGYKGRASSRAIAFALGKLFGVPTPN
jgi:hypothetical protein